MGQNATKKANRRTSPSAGRESITHALHIQRHLWEGLLILIVASSIFMFVALGSYHRSDPGWSHLVVADHVANAGGRVGAWLADVFLYLFGYLAYLFPVMLCYLSYLFYLYKHRMSEELVGDMLPLLMLRSAGFLMVLATGCGLVNVHVGASVQAMPFDAGGILGNVVGTGMLNILNDVGGTLFLFALFLVGMTLFTGLSWLRLIEMLGAWSIDFTRWAHDRYQMAEWEWYYRIKDRFADWFDRDAYEEDDEEEERQKPVIARVASPVLVEETPEEEDKPSFAARLVQFAKPKKAVADHEPLDTSPESIDAEISKAMKSPPKYAHSQILPQLQLLNKSTRDEAGQVSVEDLEAYSEEVENRLADFGVDAKVVAVHPGPVVTRYEIDLAAGTKVSKITGLAKDLARSLSVISVRIVEVIPGKSVIGIELPNNNREVVGLRDVLASTPYKQATSPLTLGLGKDIAGHPVIADLAKMPHLLVAGTTGSGKSVSLNAMLLSLLYKSTPEELRLILIDPKMLELAVYDGIPHLLTPVVTDMKDAATALRWCVVEMERRYRLMASLGVRNIAGYNEKVKAAIKKGAPLFDQLTHDDEGNPAELQPLPYIVVLADEFADMMVVVGKKVETLIARLAQKARAAGVHLIFATQRPSVDVITGLIKANIPTRIAFQVSQRVDSRTIIDQQGAEQLLGHGDMLYLPPGTGIPMRVHGAFVTDDEVHDVVASLKAQGGTNYLDEILDHDGQMTTADASYAEVPGYDDAEKDEFYDEAVEFVTKARRVSISSIQRRFKIGYNRAACIVEAMESAGVVSKMEGNGSREVLAPPPPQ